MTTYYVSSEIGSNYNAGTSTTAPLATLQAAADLVQPGDTVEVMNGTYTGPQGGDVVDITTSGTASAPITFEAAPGQTPVINSSGSWNAIKIEASYIVVNGFTVVGDAANYTLSQALAGYSSDSANLDAAGINVTGNPGVNVPNHITIENNTVYNEPGGGIGSGYADYLKILNNVVYNNAHWSAFGNSGISIFESGNSDTNSGVHDVISGNLVFGNAQLVPTNGAGAITDGEGIILDTNTAFGFVGEILVENNTVYGNGSAGIESFRTNGAVITENTVYGNNRANVLPASLDEIFLNQSNNDTVTNNITTAPDLTPPTISSLTESPSSGDLNAGKTVTYTITMSEAVTVSGGTPTLTLNDGGVATYTGGSGSNALTFRYTVGAGQNTASLAATAVNLNSATVTDGAGNAANLSLSGLTQTGPQIDTTPPPAPLIISGKVIGKRVVLTGTEAENGTTISIYEGTSLLGTTSSGPKGTWIYTTAPLTNGAHVLSATATDAAGNVSAPSSPYGPNIGAGPAITAAPIQIGTQFYIYNSAGSGVALSYAGTSVTVGQFAAWTPVTATQTASGYDIAWQNASTSQYTVWTTDSNGNYTGNLIGAVSGNSYALESLESTFNQDLNGDGVTGLNPLVIRTDKGAFGSTSLARLDNIYFLYAAGGTTGPELLYNGAAVTTGKFGGWNPIGAVQTASGYDIAWRWSNSNLFTVWTTDSNGNYTGNLIGAVSGNSYALESLESTFNQDLNGDGVTGLNPLVIRTDKGAFGSTSLARLDNIYFLNAAGGTTGPELQYNGAAVTTGKFGGWNPIGAVQTASGYDIAWQWSNSNLFTVWTTDSNGNYTGNLIGTVSGNSYALESLESAFNQDLNGDGVTGLNPLIIRTDTSALGSTTLAETGGNYFLFAAGGTTGPELQYNGALVTTREFGGWNPIGAVQTANGYEIAWKNSTTGLYTVWTTDSHGNYTGNLIGAVSGTSNALEMAETPFNQDLNGDGVIGLKPIVMATMTSGLGTTSLTQLGDNYFLYSAGGTTGPELKLNGAGVIAGTLGGWTPVGAVQTPGGYEVAWTLPGSNLFTVSSTDSNGNYISNIIGAVPGTSTAFEQAETTFGRDLNGDGVVGLYAATGTRLQLSQALSGASGAATIAANATVELAAADSASVTFTASTGTLKLDQPSTFSGEIFNFSGDGTLSGSDHIDLKGMDYNNLQDSYANGVLTVTDGRGDTAKLNFNGSYVLANFAFASDGNGGTFVYDPPVSSSSNQKNTTDLGSCTRSATIGNVATPELPAGTSASVASTGAKGALILDGTASGSQPLNFGRVVPGFGGQNVIDLPDIAFDGQTTLGYAPNGYPAEGTSSRSDGIHVANIALLGSYMASSFAIASDDHGGTSIMAESTIQSPQLLLGSPHH